MGSGGGLDRLTRPALLSFEALGVAPDVEGDGVVVHAVEDGGGDHDDHRRRRPSSRASNWRSRSSAPARAPADELKEEIGAGAVDGQVADFVNEQQARDGVDLERSSSRPWLAARASAVIMSAAVVKSTR